MKKKKFLFVVSTCKIILNKFFCKNGICIFILLLECFFFPLHSQGGCLEVLRGRIRVPWIDIIHDAEVALWMENGSKLIPLLSLHSVIVISKGSLQYRPA